LHAGEATMHRGRVRWSFSLAEWLYNHAGPHDDDERCRSWCARNADRWRRAYVRRVGDRLVRYHRLGVLLPLSHPLSAWEHALPKYGLPMCRIVRALDRPGGLPACIDVGANLGDSVARLRQVVQAPILAVEGNDVWFPLLERNVAHHRGVTAVCAFLSNRETTLPARIETETSTGRLVPAGDGIPVHLRTLDALLLEHPQFQAARFLKVDTDGFDLRVLRGAGDLLARARPVVFFEYDPQLLARLNDDPLSIFPWLRSLGYDRLSVFTNIGEWRCALTTTNRAELERLTREITPQDRSWFADICAWHADDRALADEVDRDGGTCATPGFA
jgi:FkbM family methyltransferase